MDILGMLWDWIVSVVITGCALILSLIKPILLLIFDISNITFFKDDTIGELTTRVYIIVGVLMLFKITISCIQYLVNPDKADDKENGFGGIIKRALLVVIMLAFVPSVFNLAKEAQNAIVVALPKIILGQENVTEIDDMGEKIAYTTALGFFGYSSDSCNDGSIGGLANASANATFTSLDDIKENANTIVTATCNGGKRYSFNSLLCLPASIFLVITLVSMVFDVGLRTVKLGFLELIAPIPIASYIDPKTSKKSFDSWLHNCLSVYADLFIRLGVIYLVLYLFMILLPNFDIGSSFVMNDGTTLSSGRSNFVKVAIVIALILFAKNAPKFICDVLGIKGDGDGSIANMFKRAGGFAGAGLGLGRDGYAGYRNKLKKLKAANGDKLKRGDRAKALRSAFENVGSSGKASLGATLQGKGFKEAMSAGKAAAARGYERREAMRDNNVSALDYYKQVMNRRMGINPIVDSANAEIEAGKKASDSAKASLDYAHINASTKFTNVTFSEEFMSKNVKGKFADVKDQLVIGLDASGNEVKINKSDLITEYRKDANGNLLRDSEGKLIVQKAAKYSIADIQTILDNVINDTTGKYDGTNAVYKNQAKGLQDILNGIGDMYIVNNATNTDIGVARNPAFLNSIQTAISEFMAHSGDTDFGRQIMEEAKNRGWVDSQGAIIEKHKGDFLSYVKGKGQDVQTDQKKVVGAQGAELVAKSIADKYDKKGS